MPSSPTIRASICSNGSRAIRVAGLVEQPGLDFEQLFGLDGDDPGGVFRGVFEQGHSEGNRRVRQQKGPDLGQELEQARQAKLVNLRGSLALAEADRQHLEQAALVTPGKRGVRLDPVEEDDPVGVEGVLVKVDGQAEAVGPRVTVSISQRSGQPTELRSLRIRRAWRWPSAVPPPWLPIAATMNGS